MKRLYKLFSYSIIQLFVFSINASANDTITFTWQADASTLSKSFSIAATNGETFTINWGDGSIETTGGIASNHTYIDTNTYTVIIIGNSTGLWEFICTMMQVSSLDVSKNTTLYNLDCSYNQLTRLDVSKNIVLKNLYCYDNQLLLSELYAASGKVSITNNKRLGHQSLPVRQTTVGDTVDFSSQAIFNNINTDFVVYTDYLQGIQAIINVDYTINNGIIAFKKGGNYIVTMTNTAIKSASAYSAMVFAEFIVRERSTDVSLSNLTVSKGVLNPVFHSDTLNYTVLVPYSITEMNITAISSDTNAIISGDTGLQQLSVGLNNFIITVTAEDKTTIQNYTVIVNREDTIVENNILELRRESIKVYPNPTTNQLKIKNYELRENMEIEIFDVLGRKQMSDIENRTSEILLDVSNLRAGMYFLRIDNKVKKKFEVL